MTTSLGLACIVLAAVTGGCRGKYKRKELSQSSGRAKEIRRMVERLRSADSARLEQVIAEQVVADMDDGRSRMAKAALKKLAQAEEAQILLTDRYGDNVYRVSFKLAVSGEPESLTMLLVPDQDGNLRWAGPN